MKNLLAKLSGIAFLLAVLAGTARAVPLTTLDVDFEIPPYTIGLINGQDGWNAFGPSLVTNTMARSGTQSLNTTLGSISGGSNSKDFDPGGVYSTSTDWYMESYVYVVPSNFANSANFAVGTGFGTVTISIHGDGAVEFNAGGGFLPDIRPANASVPDQWLRLLVVHAASNPPNLEMSVVGTGVNVQYSGGFTAPGGFATLYVNGPNAYWDDMKVVSGALPSVPEPSSAFLGALGLLALARRDRRRR